MKTTSKKTLTVLSCSALAAGFAQGAIVYQHYNQIIDSGNNKSLTLDLNQDGFPDFTVAFYESGLQDPAYSVNPNQKPFIISYANSSGLTNSVLANSALLNPTGLPVTPAGTTIDGSYESAQTTGYFYKNTSGTQEGSWSAAGDNDGYVGLELADSANNTYFGWAHFIYNQTNVLNGFSGTITLVDTGFETQPGVGILAGQTAEAGSAAAIFTPPSSQTNYLGGTAQLTVVGTGDAPLTYQWFSGSGGVYTSLSDGGNIAGSSSSVLTISNFSSAYAADYVVAVANANGAVTSSVPATLTTAPLLLSPLYPSPIKIYSGGHVTINVTNYGSSVPVQFQWRKNGVNLSDGGNISGSTTASLTISPVSSADAADYSVVLANTFGSVTSAADTLTVTAPSTPYAQALFSLNPRSYWPLSETGGTVAYDLVGGHNGTIAGGVALGQPGVTNSNFGSPSYAVTFGGTNYVDVPDSADFNLSNAVTTVIWVNVPSVPAQTSGLFSHGDSSWFLKVQNISFAFLGSGEGLDTWSDAYPAKASSGTPTTNTWHMLAFTYSGVPSSTTTNGWLYVDGVKVGGQLLKYAPLPAATAQNWTNVDVWIGGSPDQGVRPGKGNNQLFTGSLANAALFTNALTADQVQALYAIAFEPIHVSVQTVPGGSNVITWPVGTLLQATSLNGPWTTNAAASPYTNSSTAPQLFFKVVAPSL